MGADARSELYGVDDDGNPTMTYSASSGTWTDNLTGAVYDNDGNYLFGGYGSISFDPSTGLDNSDVDITTDMVNNANALAPALGQGNDFMEGVTAVDAVLPAVVAAPEAAVPIWAAAETYGIPATAITLWLLQDSDAANLFRIGNWTYQQCQNYGPC